MAAIKINKFLGIAPKVSGELLPPTAAQIAENCKLYSGDLIPYPLPVVADNSGRTGTTKTIYAMRNPSTGDLVWLAWSTDVDIVSTAAGTSDEQRIYYTGDGVPKVTNYALATDGAQPYPANSYTLGLPLPDTQLIAEAESAPNVDTASYARDAGNQATIVTASDHGLVTGNVVTISGFKSFAGTYTQTGTTINVTTNEDHGLTATDEVFIEFTTGAAINEVATVTLVGSTTTFTATVANSVSTSGDCISARDSFNVTNAEVSVINSTTFSYYSPGIEVATTSDDTGNVALAGNTQARSYVYTWITPWGEESIGSDPSEEIFIKEGQVVAVPNVPAGFFAPGDYNVLGVRLYRSVSSSFGTDYYRLNTLWYPVTATTLSRTSNVVTVTTSTEHNFSIDSKFRVRSSVASFTILTGAVVTDVLDDYTFTYAQVGANYTGTAGTTTFFHDVSESDTDQAQYFGDTMNGTYIQSGVVITVTTAIDHGYIAGDRVYLNFISGLSVDGLYQIATTPSSTSFTVTADASFSTSGNLFVDNYSFIDTFDPLGLTNILITDDFDAPPANLQGITAVQNNILAGFVGNELYFSEPAYPHAWPAKYKITLEYNIVALAAVAGYLFVMTEGYPYQFSGGDPATMSFARVDTLYPCLSKRGIVNMGYGVLYPTHGGLALYSPLSGGALITKALEDWDTWGISLDPTTLDAEFFDDKYFGAHSTGGIIFERDDNIGGILTTFTYSPTAIYYDPPSGKLFYAAGTAGDIYEWNNLSQPNSVLEWKSKVLESKDFINLGAARVVADYINVSTDWDLTNTDWDATTSLWNQGQNVTFKLWANKQLIFTTTVSDENVFRLPTGYRVDKFELSVETDLRVRAIHIGETPIGLKDV
jgi:hypothetical protein